MVEKFLQDIFKFSRRQRVAVIISSDILTDDTLQKLPILIEKLREIGDIKIAEVIYETKLPKDHYELLSQSGFTNKIVPGNLELNLLLESYDLALSGGRIDTIVLGSHSDNLIPLYTELRKSVSVFAFVANPAPSKAFKESFDGIIYSNRIDEFSFSSTEFEEFENLLNGNGRTEMDEVEEEGVEETNIGLISDIANIGTISEDLIDEYELRDELKKESQFEDSSADDLSN